MKTSQMASIITDIFESANSFDGIEFLYTMLRLEGPTIDNSDRLLKLKLELKEKIDKSSGLLTKSMNNILLNDVFDLIANLLRLINHIPYSMVPFFDLQNGLGHKPDVVEKIYFLIRMASESGKTEFSDLLKSAYKLETIEKLNLNQKIKTADLSKLFRTCRAFTKTFVNVYQQQRFKYKGHPRYTKIPGYQVIELLLNDEVGLYGFYSHYPSGGKSTCIRNLKDKEMTNFMGVERIQPFVGIIPFDKEWLVNGMRLHELNLTGSYNKFGEWKPIVYPSDFDGLIEEARNSSPDEDVQGSLFYILTTGFKGIEFVVKTNINLPYESGSIGSHFHLGKCPNPEKFNVNQNICVYDGWLKLDSIEPDHIKEAIASIGIAVNRLAFAYNGRVEWRVKYRMSKQIDKVLSPSNLEPFNAMLQDFPATEDSIILDEAIDWFNRAKTSNNIFASFLCYYVAIENVAQAIADGKANFGLNYTKSSKSERKSQREDCIKIKFNELYAVNPTEFVQQAYFDCVLSLKDKTKKVVALVFGEEHTYIDKLFTDNSEDGKSLLKIRSGIAHGSLSLLDKNDELLVTKRLPEIAKITKEFLTRLIFSIEPNSEIPVWSGNFTSEQTLADPRNYLIVKHEHGILDGDWKIKPEWIS